MSMGIGLYNSQDGRFNLWQDFAGGEAWESFDFGASGSGVQGLAGKWSAEAAVAGVGVFNPANNRFQLKSEVGEGEADFSFSFGPKTWGEWGAVAGDWNGNGVDGVGIYDSQSGRFYLKNELAGGAADFAFTFGPKGSDDWVAIAGDWNGDGSDGIGIYNAASGRFYLKNDLAGGAADFSFTFGPKDGGDWVAIAGDWNGNGSDGIGIYNTATGLFYLKNVAGPGGHDYTFTLDLGAGLTPLSGIWAEIPDQPLVYELHLPEYGGSVEAQTLTGADGVLDVFVVEYKSDANGGFGTFGQLTIAGYNQADGDVIVLIDENNLWTELADFTNAVQRNAGDARIVFSNDPAETFNTQWLQINGAATEGAFGQKMTNILAVDFDAVTRAEITAAGTLDEYLQATLTKPSDDPGDDPGDDPAPDGYELRSAEYGGSVEAQTLTGADGVRDVFVVNYKSDANGGFGTFGTLTIADYNAADGDVILLVDGNNAWTELADFTNAVQRNSGDARIIFSNDPAETFNTQWLQINGAATEGAFGQNMTNIIDVEFVVATADQITLVGTVDDYMDAHFAA